jgi:hypothetical protein
MALDPAGISLQAQNFNKYIKQLGKIDKTQQGIFDVDSSQTVKAFNNASRAAGKYEKELKQVSSAQKKTATGAKGLSGIEGLAGGVIGGVLAGGAIGLLSGAVQGLNNFRKESIELSRTQAAAEAQLSAAIRSTGGVAGLTANELKAQASALQDVTNFGDEATIAAQAQLLTFTKIGSTVFPQATKAILDLATRMDGDLKGATIQVGKALNDPIAGLSALTRSGIQFTDQQKEQIKTLTETGNIIAAQTIILKELENQFGGSAEAARKADGGNIALANSFGDLQEELGEVFIAFGKTFNTAETGIKIIGFLQERIKTLQQVVAFAGAGISAFGSIIGQTFDRIATTAKNIGRIFKGETTEPIKTFGQILDEAGEKATLKFKELATVFGETFDEEPIKKVSENLDEATASVDAYKNSLKQAQNLQLSFTRAAEDSALKLARANEDVARKQQRTVIKLQERQAKDRDKLLKNQQKQLDDFEADRIKQISKAENEIKKERAQAADQRKRDQQRLQRELAQAQERFNLSQLQSERRFSLSERRLRAEGDILAIQQLREDRELERQEEKENFDLSKKEQIASATEQQREQAKDLDNRVKELKASLEDQRAELLASFDEQLRAQQEQQVEARANQQQAFQESAQDRAIALQREEEDRRISQGRQLEDLGRSLADQEGVTAEGTAAIAGELEKVFGQEGVADNIITGFTARTENDFNNLFENLERVVSEAEIRPRVITPRVTTGAGGRGRVGGIPEFQEGGIVPGPLGSPQIVQAHAGETILPTHQRSFQAIAPVIPSQSLEVLMSGGFDIRGGEQAGEAAVQAAVTEMTETIQVAVRRLARRN